MTGQMNLYELLGLEDDPVYRKINSLKENEETKVDSFKVRKTNKFYEVENEEMHEGFKTIKNCYLFISAAI